MNLEATTMATRTAFGGSNVSARIVAVVVAVVAVFLLGGIGSYVVKALGQPTTSSSVSQPLGNSLSGTPARSLRGGPQTLDGPASSGSATTKIERRFGGIQP
jgi:hypothetical protein